MLALIEQIIGTTYYTTEINAIDGSIEVIYSLPYIVASLLILISFKAIFTWITILVKAGAKVGGND